MEFTPKEYAKELVDKYLDIEKYNNQNLDLFCDECGISLKAAKICAIISHQSTKDLFERIFMTEGSMMYIWILEVEKELKNYDI